MKKFESKLERISRFEQLLLAHPEGLKRAEIAHRLGTHRSTISRYLVDTRNILPIWEENKKIYINRDSYLNNVRLTIHEIMVLHLATRLYSCRTDKHNPHACSAMRKLGHSLSSYSRCISDYMLATAEYIEKSAASYNKSYIDVLEKITRAWSDGFYTHVHYYSQKYDEIHEYDFAPYFIEPYAAGFSIYAVGFCKEKNHLVTLKIERIKKVEIKVDKFTPPETFDPELLFKDAWGIWYADGEPQEVVLRFSTRVADRVRETVWHKSQIMKTTSEGKVLFRVIIAEPLEMVPWIRGWGSDCEVLAPKDLRQLMCEEVRKMGEIYG